MKNITLTLSLLLTACGGGGGNTTPPSPANVAPMANFTVACTDLDCTFTDSSTDSDGTIASYAWDFGDGSTSTEASPSHTFGGYGDYTVSLTITDDDGATGMTSQTVGVTVDVHSSIATIDFTQGQAIIFTQDFNHRADGLYTPEDMLEDFECPTANANSSNRWCQYPNYNLDEARIESGELKVTLTERLIGTGIGMVKYLEYDYQELYLTFKLRFNENYDTTTKGGKLMGLYGNPLVESGNGWEPNTLLSGCGQPGPDDGFSVRYTYRQQSQITHYIYHQDKTDECGDNRYITDSNGIDTFKFIKNQTYILELRVKMNDSNIANGLVQTRINGVLLRTDDDFMFSQSGNYGINEFVFLLYIGGGSSDFELLNPSTLHLDDFVISTSSVVTPQ